MKLNLTAPAGLLLLSTIMLAGSMYLSVEMRDMRREIEHLNDRNYNDSVLLYEYQKALNEFMKEDSICAMKFMQKIESINTTQ